MYVVWSPKLNCRIIVDDAETKNQAKAAYRRHLKTIGINGQDIKHYMTGLEITPYIHRGYKTIIKVE